MRNSTALNGGHSAAEFPSGASRSTTQKNSLVFIDPSAKDTTALILGAGPKSELIFLSAARGGLAQVANHLNRRGRLSLIHLMADFSLGRLTLGNQRLDTRGLREHAAILARIGYSVRDGGEILIGAGGQREGQSDVFRRALETHAAVPVRLWDGGAPREPGTS
jgi:hypothetical protein